MGAFLDSPITAKELDEGSGNGLLAGVSSMQGWRKEMEVPAKLFPCQRFCHGFLFEPPGGALTPTAACACGSRGCACNGYTEVSTCAVEA